MKALRARPPWRIGGADVSLVADYSEQLARSRDGSTTRIPLPRSNMVVFELNDGSRVIARPSGTEPKIKFYFDVRETLSGTEPMADAERRATSRLEKLRDAFLELAVPSR